MKANLNTAQSDFLHQFQGIQQVQNQTETTE